MEPISLKALCLLASPIPLPPAAGIRIKDITKVSMVIADMRKLIRQDQRIIQRLHRRVFLDKLTREQVSIYVSCYVEAANRDAFMSVKQDLLLAFVECIERNGAQLARNRLQVCNLQHCLPHSRVWKLSDWLHSEPQINLAVLIESWCSQDGYADIQGAAHLPVCPKHSNAQRLCVMAVTNMRIQFHFSISIYQEHVDHLLDWVSIFWLCCSRRLPGAPQKMRVEIWKACNWRHWQMQKQPHIKPCLTHRRHPQRPLTPPPLLTHHLRQGRKGHWYLIQGGMSSLRKLWFVQQ